MSEYRLSRQAERDLLNVYVHTDRSLGSYQADVYHFGFEQSFRLLAKFPSLGLSADKVAPGLRRFRFQDYTIFYTKEADHVFLRAVIPFQIEQSLKSADD